MYISHPLTFTPITFTSKLAESVSKQFSNHTTTSTVRVCARHTLQRNKYNLTTEHYLKANYILLARILFNRHLLILIKNEFIIQNFRVLFRFETNTA